jgi:3-dehydroquinate dehydratase I
MICVSIAEPDFSTCLDLIRKYEFIELRLDAANFSISQIEELISSAKQSVVTFRPGHFDIQTRLTAIIASIHAGATMIDLELDAEVEYRIELMNIAKSKNCQVLLSYHDFKTTPSLAVLINILNDCYHCGADIAKIACQVNSVADNARLLSLYSQSGKKIILGMGNLGRITRLAAPYLGAAFTYASVNEGSNTAPGQLTFQELNDLQHILNYNSK